MEASKQVHAIQRDQASCQRRPQRRQGSTLVTRLRFLRLVRSSRKLRYIGIQRVRRATSSAKPRIARTPAAARAPMGPVLLCMEIQRYAAPKLVIKTATTARDLFEAEAPSSAGAPPNTIVRAEPLWVVRTKCGPPIAAMSQDKLARGRRSAVGRLFAAAANATFSPSTRFWRAPAPAGDGPRSSARCGARIP